MGPVGYRFATDPAAVYGGRGFLKGGTGSIEASIEKEDRDNDYRHFNNDNSYDNNDENYRATIRWRHNLGSACTKEFKQVQQENMELKQQLELMKMCGRVNNNPSLAQNKNFRLLVSKCTGVTPTNDRSRPEDSGSAWDSLKNEYKKENPDVTLMGDKFITNKKKLVIPKYLTEDTDKEIILPVPKD